MTTRRDPNLTDRSVTTSDGLEVGSNLAPG